MYMMMDLASYAVVHRGKAYAALHTARLRLNREQTQSLVTFSYICAGRENRKVRRKGNATLSQYRERLPFKGANTLYPCIL
jgi:hypothetical protein